MARHPRDATAKPGARQAPSPPAASDDDAPGPGGGERVAKALARAGVASRREVERMVAEGRVALNGRVLETPAVKVGPGDVLTVDGAPVAEAQPTRVWRYHKPTGLVTTNSDPRGRPTVFDALPPGLPRVISVGRLDLNSEGLLLLTNDGELARALELPATGWVRRYRVRARGRVTQERLDQLKDGVTVEGVRYGPIEARIDKATGAGARPSSSSGGGATPANLWISVALTEGKNREVRRVLASLGLEVNRLIRLAYGPFALATLPSGAVEEVGPRVIREQLTGLVATDAMPTGERAPPAPGEAAAAGAGRRTPARSGPPGARAKPSPGAVLIDAPPRGGAASRARRGGRGEGAPAGRERPAAAKPGAKPPAGPRPPRPGGPRRGPPRGSGAR